MTPDRNGSDGPVANADRIAEWLPLFFAPDDVLELRELGERKRAAYLRASDIPAKAHLIAAVGKNVYFTPQVVNPDCLGRFAHLNLFVEVNRHHKLTADADVVARRYVLIDVDAIRPASTSATDAEKDSARAVALKVRDCMAAKGWADPLEVDSGNGVHLYYRMIPELATGPSNSQTDPVAQLLRCLAAKFDTDQAKIDTSVWNPSRIMRVPGSMARKGESTAERPHRECRVEKVPSDWGSQTSDRSKPLADLIAELDPDSSIRFGSKSAGPALAFSASAPIDLNGLPSYAKRVERACKYLARIDPAISGKMGSNPTYKAARVLVHGFCLDENTALSLLINEYNPKCDPTWKEKDLAHKVRDAATDPFNKPRGWLLVPKSKSSHSAPAAPAIPPSAPAITDTASRTQSDLPCNAADDDPTLLADYFMEGYKSKDRRTLAYWRGDFHEWDGTAYKTIAEHDFRPTVTRAVMQNLRTVHGLKLKVHFEQRANGGEVSEELPRLPKVSRSLIGNVSLALESICQVRSEESPAWIGVAGPEPAELVAAQNGLVHMPKYANGEVDAIAENTPEYLNFNAVQFKVDRSAPKPTNWLWFLDQLWPGDSESIALLQEWFGYLLTPSNRFQKMLLLHGPTRCGKGTISEILQSLVGKENCAAPTLGSLGGEFGAESLIGMSVAVIEDARLNRKTNTAVISERLLTISGAGRMDVNRKHRPLLRAARLNTRFVVATNEIPDLPDTSGALPGRWCVLKFVESWEGREDETLPDRLRMELPGIFNWAVEGWDRLRRRRCFTEPKSSFDLVSTMKASSSDVGDFVRQRCNIGPNESVTISDLYDGWKLYCSKQGIKEPGKRSAFGRNMRSAVPKLTSFRPRVNGIQVEKYLGISLRSEPNEFGWNPAATSSDSRYSMNTTDFEIELPISTSVPF